MRLNMDCVRDILLCVEENTGIRQTCRFIDSGLSSVESFLGHPNDENYPDYEIALLEKYDNDTLIYHVRYCVEAELLSVSNSQSRSDIIISDLTPDGHELLNNIRNISNWEKIKDVKFKAGSFGLDVLKEIAKTISTTVAMQFLHLS